MHIHIHTHTYTLKCMKTKRRAPTNMVLTASAVPFKEIAILNGIQGLEILRRKCMYVCMYVCIYISTCMSVSMYT
jgi:hypothetical protein